MALALLVSGACSSTTRAPSVLPMPRLPACLALSIEPSVAGRPAATFTLRLDNRIVKTNEGPERLLEVLRIDPAILRDYTTRLDAAWFLAREVEPSSSYTPTFGVWQLSPDSVTVILRWGSAGFGEMYQVKREGGRLVGDGFPYGLMFGDRYGLVDDTRASAIPIACPAAHEP